MAAEPTDLVFTYTATDSGGIKGQYGELQQALAQGFRILDVQSHMVGTQNSGYTSVTVIVSKASMDTMYPYRYFEKK